MINLVLPMCGINPLSKELGYPFPAPLVEIAGTTLLEHTLNSYISLPEALNVVALFTQESCDEYSIHRSFVQKCDSLGISSRPVILRSMPKGALATVLLGLSELDLKDPLIISNYDQIIDNQELHRIYNYLIVHQFSAVVPTINSIHPRWAYVRSSNDGRVYDVSEKIPISGQAIAGIYCFTSTEEFLECSLKAIYNERTYKSLFYISSVLYEYILLGKSVASLPIDQRLFHSFYSAQRVLDYERSLA